jgi:hypothetical protein
VAKKLIPCVTTDLSSPEMLSLVKSIAVNNISNLESQRIPVDNSFTPDMVDGGAAVLRFNAQWNSEALHHFIYGTDYDETMYSAPEALNPAGETDDLAYYGGETGAESYTGDSTEYGDGSGTYGGQDGTSGYSDDGTSGAYGYQDTTDNYAGQDASGGTDSYGYGSY